jgi:hypothetical protein
MIKQVLGKITLEIYLVEMMGWEASTQNYY